MQASISFPRHTRRRQPGAMVAGASTVLGILVLVCFGSLSKAAPTGNPAQGEFEGERQYQGKDGQEHDIEEPTKQERTLANNAMRAGKAASSDEQLAFEKHIQYHVHALTWSENVAKLPELRTALKKQLVALGRAAAPDLHDELNRTTLKICGDAAADDRYPMAIRFNCLLMIGDLDAKEGSAASRAVTPLPEARKLLMEVLSDAQQPEILRIAALVGLRRNILAGMPADEQNTLVESLMKIIGTPLDPKKDSIATLWLRLRAIDAMHQLTAKGLKTDQQAIAAALSPLVADPQIPIWIRCHAAGELAGVESQQFTAEQVVQDVQALAGLVIAMSASNPFTKFAHQAALEKEAAERAEDGRNRSARRRPTADKDDEEKDDEKEKADAEPVLPLTKPMRDVAVHALLYDLGRVRLGLMGREPAKKGESPHSATHGLFAAANDEVQKAITSAVHHIDAMLTELNKLNDKKDVLKEDVAKVALSIEDSGRQLAETLSEQAAAEENPQSASEAEPSVASPAVRRGKPSGNAPAGESAVGP